MAPRAERRRGPRTRTAAGANQPQPPRPATLVLERPGASDSSCFMAGKHSSLELPESTRPARDMAWRMLDAVHAFILGGSILHGCVLDANLPSLDEAGLRLEDGRRGLPLWDCPWWSHSDEEQRKVRSACEVARRGEVVHGEGFGKMAREERAVDFQVAPLRDSRGRLATRPLGCRCHRAEARGRGPQGQRVAPPDRLRGPASVPSNGTS